MGHAEHNLRWTPKASGVRSGPGACMFTWIYLERFMEQSTALKKKTTTRDMTTGNIAKEIMLFALPLMFGNIFQMLYNTVDSIVVGNYVSTEALAAVGATTMIVNMAVFFFNGFSIGAGVIIGRYFGAKNMERLHDSIETTMATTLGAARKEAELMPMMSRASICCVTRMVPSSEAMLEPTLPARIRHMILDENSSNRISRVVYPDTHRGIHGLCMLSFIWMQITAPMKNEIRSTMPMESTPSCDISLIYCFRNMRMRSGREKARPINMRYLPKVVSHFSIIMLYNL